MIKQPKKITLYNVLLTFWPLFWTEPWKELPFSQAFQLTGKTARQNCTDLGQSVHGWSQGQDGAAELEKAGF